MPAVTMDDILLQQLQNSYSSAVINTASSNADNASVTDTYSRTASLLAAPGLGAASSFSSQVTQLQAPYLWQHPGGQQRCPLQPAPSAAVGTTSAGASLTVAADVGNLLQAVLGTAQQNKHKGGQLLLHQQQQQQQELQHSSSLSSTQLHRLLPGVLQSTGTAAGTYIPMKQLNALQQQTAVAATAAHVNPSAPMRTDSSSSLLLHTLSEVAGTLSLPASAGTAADAQPPVIYDLPGLSALLRAHTDGSASSAGWQLNSQGGKATAAPTEAIAVQLMEVVPGKPTVGRDQQQELSPLLEAPDAAATTPEPAAHATTTDGLTVLEHKQQSPSLAAGAWPVISALSVGVSCGGSELDQGGFRLQSETSAGAAAAAAALVQGPEAVSLPAGGVDRRALLRLLQEVVTIKKQALACVKDAVALGVLVPNLVTAAAKAAPRPAAVVAPSAGQLQRDKRGREMDSADGGTAAPMKRVHRHSIQTTAADPAESTLSKEGTARSAPGVEDAAADMPADIAAAEVEPAEQQTDLSATTVGSREPDAAGCDRFPSNVSVTIPYVDPAQQQQPQQQQQQCQVVAAAAPEDPPATDDVKPSSDTDHAAHTFAAACASAVALSSPAVAAMLPHKYLELMLRTVAVMCKSNKLNKSLAAVIVPSVTRNHQVAAAAQQAAQLDSEQLLAAATTAIVDRASSSSSLATPHEIHSLRQQLMVAKVSLSVKQQAVLKLQAEVQASATAHTRQLHLVSEAVRKLMVAACAEGVQVQDKQQLVGIAAEILKAIV